MAESYWWKAEPPPNGNEGNPWFVRDGSGAVQAIISHTIPGIDEKIAKYIASLGTSCAGHERRADAADVENEQLQSHADQLEFCLKQARIVLEHFKTELADPEHRRIAEGGLIASAPPGSLPGER